MAWQAVKVEGDAHFRKGEYADALRAYTNALREAPTEAELWGNRGLVHAQLRNYVEALADVLQSVTIDRRFAEGYVRVVGAQLVLGDFSLAATTAAESMVALQSLDGLPPPINVMVDLRRCRREGEQAAAALSMEADEGSRGGPYAAETVAALRLAKQRFPDSPKVVCAFARSIAATEPEAAYSALLPLTKEHGDDLEYIHTRGIVQYHRGIDGIVQSSQLLRAVLHLDPDNVVAARMLRKIRSVDRCQSAGDAAYREARIHEAIGHYSAALEIDPANVRLGGQIRGRRAAAYLDVGDAVMALADCTAAIDAGNNAPTVLALRSRANVMLERRSDAAKSSVALQSVDRPPQPLEVPVDLGRCQREALKEWIISLLSQTSPHIDRSMFVSVHRYDDVAEEAHVRGCKPYYRPVGSVRFAVNVSRIFEEEGDAWIGRGSGRDVWPNAYHGIAEGKLMNIFKHGHPQGGTKGVPMTNGQYDGQYVTPYPSTALRYAEPFLIPGLPDTYRILCQCRVRPGSFREVGEARKFGNRTESEYWIASQPGDVRRYGICFFSSTATNYV